MLRLAYPLGGSFNDYHFLERRECSNDGTAAEQSLYSLECAKVDITAQAGD
jgi:hypothetical protein